MDTNLQSFKESLQKLDKKTLQQLQAAIDEACYIDNSFTDILHCKSFSSFSTAWKEVIAIYKRHTDALINRFTIFNDIVMRNIDEDREISYEEKRKIIEECNKKLVKTKRDCTYPIIGLKPERDMIGELDEYENKILFKNNEYWITITQPENPLLSKYYEEEFEEIINSYNQSHPKEKKLEIFVGASKMPIPITFLDDIDGKKYQSIKHPTIRKIMGEYFVLPDLKLISDALMDRNHKKYKSSYEHLLSATFDKNILKHRSIFNNPVLDGVTLHPLARFDALRTDYSIKRLEHYTHTKIEDFQPFVIFTNYERYVYKFLHHFHRQIVEPEHSQYDPNGRLVTSSPNTIHNTDFIIDASKGIDDFVHLKNDTYTYTYNIDRTAQMPAFHYIPGNGTPGITLINIGVGPSNAKNITDHLAVLRPYCWFMLGHCGGLRTRQQLGQFISAKEFVRDDRVLDDILHKRLTKFSVPLLIQNAFEFATWAILLHRWKTKKNISQMLPDGTEYKLSEEQIREFSKHFRSKMRTGKVYTTADRNWELHPIENLVENLDISEALAIDMESATIAGNGNRYKIPFGAFLCISDLPLDGESKMRNMADQFYDESTEIHLQIALDAIVELSSKKATLTSLKGFDNIGNFEMLKKLREFRGRNEAIFR